MKIIFVLPRYHTNQYFWTKTLQDNGHQVRYLVAGAEPGSENYTLAKPDIIPHRPLPGWMQTALTWYMRTFGGKVRAQFLSFPNQKILRKQLLDSKPDLVIIREISYPLSFFTFLACKQLGIPTIRYTLRPLERAGRPITRLLQIAGIVPRISITPTRMDRSATSNVKTGAHYVPLITDFPFDGARKQYAPAGVVRLLFVGKFVSIRKNHLLLLDALAHIKRQINFKLIMVGSDGNADPEYLTTIQKRIASLGLNDMVEIVFNMPHREMGAMYADADMFILPSANEAFGISVIEAMNHALPVIVTDTCGAQHCVEHGISGYIVKTNDSQDLAEKILAAADTVSLQRMGNNAYAYHQQEHTPDAMYAAFMKAVRANEHP